jgi:hypothetical protein
MAKLHVDASEVLNNIDNLIDRLPNKLAEGMEQAALYVESEAKKSCPIDDSILRASISHYVETEGTKVTGYVGSNIEYAPYVHQGTGLYAIEGNGRKDVPWSYRDIRGEWHTTSGMKPTPFLQDAIDTFAPKALSYFKGLLEK